MAKSKRETTLSLTLEFGSGGERVEIHTLNPGSGEFIERFGGSKHGLYAEKTASIVTRSYGGNSMTDHEMDIYDFHFWEWIARIINGEVKAKCKATAQPVVKIEDEAERLDKLERVRERNQSKL